MNKQLIVPPLYDAVRIVHTSFFLQRTVGVQAVFPTCVNFYASMNPIQSTKGVMMCQVSKRRSTEILDAKVNLVELKNVWKKSIIDRIWRSYKHICVEHCHCFNDVTSIPSIASTVFTFDWPKRWYAWARLHYCRIAVLCQSGICLWSWNSKWEATPTGAYLLSIENTNEIHILHRKLAQHVSNLR